MLFFWKGNGTRTPKTMFLSVNNHLWEILLIKQAKITWFGRAEWKSVKNTIYENPIWASAHERAHVIFSVVKDDPLGSPQKNLGPLGPSKKCHKINILSVSSLFLAFLECLDTKKNYSQLPSHPHCHHKKNQKFWSINVILKNIFVMGSNLTPMLKES